MARILLFGFLACGAVWMSGTGVASSHDEGWGDAVAQDAGPYGPPDPAILASYGEWVGDPEIGRAWRPYVGDDWRPYWRGHWAWRGDWVWVSADPWGDGPFHYGEWVRSRRFGWIWVPGTIWAPARVTWVVSGPMISWAPAGIHVHLGVDPRWWVYADAQAFHGPVVHPYRVPPPHAKIRGGVVTRDLGRVFVPDRRSPRDVRVRAGSERTRAVDRNLTAQETDSGVRRPVPDGSRVRASESNKTRGFKVRDRR